MINLLTPQSRALVKKEYRHRRLVVGGFLLLAILVAAILLGGLLLWQLRRERQLIQNPGQAPSEVSAHQVVVAEINQAAQDLARVQGAAHGVALTTLWQETLARRPAGLKLFGWRWERGEDGEIITLGGEAATRAALLAYVGELKRETRFATVDSPVSNLIKSRDLPFTINITLAPHD